MSRAAAISDGSIIVKQCRCGASFTQMEWNALRFVGLLESQEDFSERYDLRDCQRCGSTISLELPPRSVEDLSAP
jgi:hypothetical protein